MTEHRNAQLLQARERQLHLRLDAGRTYHSHTGHRTERIVQQGRLPDAGLAVHDDRGAVSLAHLVQQLVQERTLAFAPKQQITLRSGTSHSLLILNPFGAMGGE